MDNTLFSTAMRLVDPVMGKVSDSNLHGSTPCSEWDVEKLTNHMIGELAWIAPLVAGKTIAQVGDTYEGDLINGDAATSWMKFCKEASAAIQMGDPKSTAHLSYTDKPNQAFVDEVAADLIVHGWDLAKAVGADYPMTEETAKAVQKSSSDILEGARQAGMIATALPSGKDATAVEKLLCSYGRDPAWSAPAR